MRCTVFHNPIRVYDTVIIFTDYVFLLLNVYSLIGFVEPLLSLCLSFLSSRTMLLIDRNQFYFNWNIRCIRHNRYVQSAYLEIFR